MTKMKKRNQALYVNYLNNLISGQRSQSIYINNLDMNIYYLMYYAYIFICNRPVN